MVSHFKIVMLSVVAAIAALPGSAFAGEQMKGVPAAPVPAQILAAKRVFIANAGGDQMSEDEPIFSGGPDRAYNQFYAAMKSWGRFEIVGSPADADLLIEVKEEVLTVVLRGGAGGSATPMFGLRIRDAKTLALLWGFQVHSKFGLGQGSSDKNFDQAVDRLVTDMRMLVEPSPPPAGGAGRP